MRMRPDQIELLANYLAHHWSKEKLATFPKGEAVAIKRIMELIIGNFEEEDRINEEASRLLEQNKRKFGQGLDEDRAFSMIRKQLAKERGFVL